MKNTKREQIGKLIRQAINNEKLLFVNYSNRSGEIVKFWLAIMDIIFDEKTPIITGKIYNPALNINDCRNAPKLYLDNIQSAEIIEFSHYDVPAQLKDTLEQHTGHYSWLQFNTEVKALIDYYKSCYYFDCDPYRKDYCLVRGIDTHILLQRHEYCLDEQQKKDIINILQHHINRQSNTTITELIISKYAIDKGDNKLYVICYYHVNYNPLKGTLCISDKLQFNYSFLHFRKAETTIKAEAEKSLLNQYIEMDVDKFVNLYMTNETEARSIIESNLRTGETINTRPVIMLLERRCAYDISPTFDAILKRDTDNTLNVPLKAFLGRMSSRYKRTKEPNIIVCDEKINIDQTRVLYNAMKQPVTYVQGPPGTGKTQTILNVVINGFYNQKTVLVCSSNNKPVDGIINKLNFTYRGERIPFPFIRLGNFDVTTEALEQITQLFDYQSRYEPDERKLNHIRTSTDTKNEALRTILAQQEKHVDLEIFLNSSNAFMANLHGQESKITKNVQACINKIQRELEQTPRVENDEILHLYTPLEKDAFLQQFMYYYSLSSIRYLQSAAFNELRAICAKENAQEKVFEFNKWLAIDTNMQKFTKAFPVIFTTNISARRLGSPDYMFDLVVMDEAGQCNVVSALIPITKANALLLVGDPQQLKPVIVLDDTINKFIREQYAIPQDYDYKHMSVLDVMRKNDSISQYVRLTYHYRCGKRIINFSNQKYYNSILNLTPIIEDGELLLLDIKNSNTKVRNSAYDEAIAIVNYIKNNNLHDTAIITPFVNQKDLINDCLQKQGIYDVECHTIHSMQGGEKDTIIISTALSPKTSRHTFEWVMNNTEIINVAITRAKKRLIIANDFEATKILANNEQSDLMDLIEYVKSKGCIQVPASPKVEIGKSNGSVNEDEFYKTVTHFCSVHSSFEARRNVPFNKIFADDEILNKSQSEFDCVLYSKTRLFNRLVPEIAIEINGGEHFGDKVREQADKRKIEICKKKHIHFIMIPNSMVKEYEHLRTILLASKKINDTQTNIFTDDMQ